MIVILYIILMGWCGMSIKDEFLTQFRCDPPEGTPKEITSQYQFLSSLSKKATREVYLLQDKTSGEKAILKITQPGDPEDLEREYRILSELSHEGIPHAISYCAKDDIHYLLRSYAEGETLDLLVARDGVFDQHRVLEIILALCNILSYLHKHNPPIIYRDIKPQNILLTPNGKLSLIDFGISKERLIDDPHASDTIATGSRDFAAPENYGFTKSGPYTDIFGIGRLIAWLATGSSDPTEQQRKQLSNPLEKVIEKCVRLSPEHRYRSVDALSRHIKRILYPPSRTEMGISFVVAVFVLILGVFLCQKIFHYEEQKAYFPQEPVYASGFQYEKEAAFLIEVAVKMDGKPLPDCVVAIDNRHWYYPSEEGTAILWAYAYDQYTLKAARNNQTAQKQISVNRGTPLSLELDFSNVPTAPEYLEFQSFYGKSSQFDCQIQHAAEITLQGQPLGLDVITEGQTVSLHVDRSLDPGHYFFFIEAKNEFGFAHTAVSLYIESSQNLIPISTAQELDAIRHNPDKSYELVSDIDLSDIDWVPIGSIDHPFTGKISGNGHRIVGLTISGDHTQAGLFGMVQGAVFDRIILESPSINISHNEFGNIGSLVASMQGGLIKNCGIMNGKITASIGNQSNVGGLIGYANGFVENCFNSADIQVVLLSEGDTETNVGGICGILLGYLTGCGNTGEISGSFVTGGLVGMNDNSVITGSYNAGNLQGALVNGQFPPGAICHIIRVGRYVSNSCYQSGTAEIGTSVTTNGYPIGIEVHNQLQDKNILADILDKTPNSYQYASLHSDYPLPAGLLNQTVSTPDIQKKDNHITIIPEDETVYFYSYDANPASFKQVDQPELMLQSGQVLYLFAAKKGSYDSEIIKIE